MARRVNTLESNILNLMDQEDHRILKKHSVHAWTVGVEPAVWLRFLVVQVDHAMTLVLMERGGAYRLFQQVNRAGDPREIMRDVLKHTVSCFLREASENPAPRKRRRRTARS